MTTPATPSPELIRSYRDNGFVKIRGLISTTEAAEYREAALRASRDQKPHSDGAMLRQTVNAWRGDARMKQLTLDPHVAAVATCLAGVPLRLWHDQILIKQPQNRAATEFHQDQPYWPHGHSANPITAWIALGDVPVERGCLSFIPASHRHTGLRWQRLDDPRSLFTLCPELEWEPRVTLPLQAGDCTFHHGCCAHMATANLTDVPRVAHAVIYMDATTTFSGARHPVTDPLGLKPGQPLDGELFPLLP